MLQHSPAISNSAIAEMARCKGDKHLEAIAARRDLHEKITGILIRRGGLQVLAALGQNETAAISSEGLHSLGMRLRHHEQASRRSERRLQHSGARRRIGGVSQLPGTSRSMNANVRNVARAIAAAWWRKQHRVAAGFVPEAESATD